MIDDLYSAHARNRTLFEEACASDDMSQEEFIAIREAYNKSLNAYLAALETTQPVKLFSDGGSREQPFDPADAAGVRSGSVTDTGKQEGRTGFKFGAVQTPGSSMSSGPAKPIVAGQAPGPSENTSAFVGDQG